MTVGEHDAGFGKARHRHLERGACLGRGLFPSGRLQHRQRARSPRRGRFGRTLQSGIPRIAADPGRDVDRDEPGIFERGGEHAGAALAEVVEAAAAIKPADARLEADAAAKAGGPQDRPHDLCAEGRGHHAASHRGGGAAARSARGALPVPRIARSARLGRGKLGRHDLPEDYRTGLAQCRDAGAVATGTAADE